MYSIKENKEYTVVKLLCRLGVKVEVFEELRRPVLLVTLAVTTLPPQVTPRILQLQETHSLQQQHTTDDGRTHRLWSQQTD